ncbi:MAG: SMC-Scp complex subunit ScpB [Lachnospiraceae bacterium]|nr:SMC-Scp complex subunit ScpB [Lachnospiraceae bacterium]
MDKKTGLTGALEAVLFAMGEPVSLKMLAAALNTDADMALEAVRELQKLYEEADRGIRLLELEDSYQLCTKPEYYENLITIAAMPEKPVLTDTVLETLAIVAYRQPVTKAEINKIRGVSSDHAVSRLVEYGLIQEAGRLNAPGRPMLFVTTREFLRRFGMDSLEQLPETAQTAAGQEKAKREEAEKTENTERAEETEQTENTEKAEETEKTENTEKAEQIEQTEGLEQSKRSDAGTDTEEESEE